MTFELIPGSEKKLKVCEEAEEKAHSTRGVGSASFRRNEAKAMVVAHVVDFLRYQGALLLSENCVLLHRAVEEEADPTAPSPMAAAAAPEKCPAQKEKKQAAGSGGLSGGEAARNSSTPEPVEGDGSQDDRDLVHLVTAQSHGSEMGLLIVNIVRVMRNSDERYSWFDLEDALLQASRLAQDTGLERKRTILDKAQRPHVGHPKRGGYPGSRVYTPPARGPSVFAGPPVILPLHRGQGKERSHARASQPGQSHGQAGTSYNGPAGRPRNLSAPRSSTKTFVATLPSHPIRFEALA
eukprot:jgi/Undpi1/5291/HiC_scaffold_2.g00572.m1